MHISNIGTINDDSTATEKIYFFIFLLYLVSHLRTHRVTPRTLCFVSRVIAKSPVVPCNMLPGGAFLRNVHAQMWVRACIYLDAIYIVSACRLIIWGICRFSSRTKLTWTIIRNYV